jgi:DNA repair ATPase RecN
MNTEDRIKEILTYLNLNSSDDDDTYLIEESLKQIISIFNEAEEEIKSYKAHIETLKQDLSPNGVFGKRAIDIDSILDKYKAERDQALDTVERVKKEITARQLHEWYLEAITSGVAGDQYNPNAIKPYDELTQEQQAIDKFIAECIKKRIEEEL